MKVLQGAGSSPKPWKKGGLSPFFHWVPWGWAPGTSSSDVAAMSQWAERWWWPAWLAQNRCLLAIREAWDRQPWCEAGRPLSREAGAACGNRGWLLQMVALLSLTAATPDRDMSRPWHTSVPFHILHSAKECFNFLQGYWPKDQEIPYPVPLHLILYPVTESVMFLQTAGRSPQLWKKGALQHPPSFCETYYGMKKVYT